MAAATTTAAALPNMTALVDDGSGILMLGKLSLDPVDEEEDEPEEQPAVNNYHVKKMTRDPTQWDESQYKKQAMTTFHNDWALHKSDKQTFELFYNTFDSLHRRWFGHEWQTRQHKVTASGYDSVKSLAVGGRFLAALSFTKATADAVHQHAQSVERQLGGILRQRDEAAATSEKTSVSTSAKDWLSVADVHSDTVPQIELFVKTDEQTPGSADLCAALEATPKCHLSLLSWQTSVDAHEDRWFHVKRIQCHMPCVAEFADNKTLVLLSRNRLRVFDKGMPLMKAAPSLDMTLPFPPTCIYRMTVNARYIVLFAVQPQCFVVIARQTPDEWLRFTASAVHATLYTHGVTCIHLDEQSDVLWCGTSVGQLFGVHLPTRKLAYTIMTEATLVIRHIRSQARRIVLVTSDKLVLIDQTPGNQGVYFDLQISNVIDVRIEGNMFLITLRTRDVWVMNALTHKVEAEFNMARFRNKVKIPSDWHHWSDDLSLIGFDRSQPTRCLMIHPDTSSVSLELRAPGAADAK
jgi:hypothetical protein